jgi:hypothetical protein
MTIEYHLQQVRLLADASEDNRSLVAIAARYERQVITGCHSMPEYLRHSITTKSHTRNRRTIIDPFFKNEEAEKIWREGLLDVSR